MGFPRQEYWGGLPLPSPAVGAAQILIWSQSCLFLRQCPQLSELMCFLLWELSVAFYVFHRYRVWLVDHVDSVCSVYSSWEGLGSSSLATLPLGFTCGFMSTSACGSSTGVCSWGCPGGLGFAPVRARSGGGAAAWMKGFWQHQVLKGGWRLGQQEIQCFRRGWQPVLANTLQYSCLEDSLPDREAWQATVYRVTKSLSGPKWLCTHKHNTFFFF